MARRNLPLEERKERILVVALKLFMTQGYAATTIDEIVATAGGSKSSIYQLFDGKEGILETLIDRECDEIVRHTFHLPGSKETLPDYLSVIARKYLRSVLSDHTICLLRQCISVHAETPKLGRAYLDRGLGQALIKLAAALETFKKDQGWEIANTLQMAEEFLAMCRGRLHLQMLLGFLPPDLDEAIEHRANFATAAFQKIYRASVQLRAPSNDA